MKKKQIQAIIDKVEALRAITDGQLELDLLNDILRDLKKLNDDSE